MEPQSTVSKHAVNSPDVVKGSNGRELPGQPSLMWQSLSKTLAEKAGTALELIIGGFISSLLFFLLGFFCYSLLFVHLLSATVA